eukprot:TRINITY_DN2218_c0_g1_i1.p1 TRINITY_DN2218_c0_g1~~TRINITY_DN2218_c0_g1_i1.p1  ORF type:complete len:144 (+),score=17.73 TRINITY_DN2218_c0_g1_i1:180-611(+)
MVKFYREVYVCEGITDIVFPTVYPTGAVIGCVEVRECLRLEDVVECEEIPASLKMEALSDFCWFCEQPQRLIVAREMKGAQRLFPLPKNIALTAPPALRPVPPVSPLRLPQPFLEPKHHDKTPAKFSAKGDRSKGLSEPQRGN